MNLLPFAFSRNTTAFGLLICLFFFEVHLRSDLAPPYQDPAQPLSLMATNRGGNGDSGGAIFSGNGQRLVFMSSAQNLVAETCARGVVNVFVHDLETRQTWLASRDYRGGAGGNQLSSIPMISADGRWVTFESLASNLAPNDANEHSDVFLYDVVSGSTVLASANTNGTSVAGQSYRPILTPNGQAVVFHSLAGDLVSGDTNQASDLFLRDFVNHQTVVIHALTNSPKTIDVPLSKSTVSETATGAQISGDGRFVVYHSKYPPKISLSSSPFQVYARDTLENKTILISTSGSTKVAGNGNSTNPVVSWNGSNVVFVTTAKDITQDFLGMSPTLFAPFLVWSQWGQQKKVIVDSASLNDWVLEYYLSPDGASLAIFKGSGWFRVMDLQKGTTILTNSFALRSDVITSLEGQYIAVSAFDGTNQLWQHYLYSMGEDHLEPIPLPADAIISSVSSDGQKIAFTSQIGDGMTPTIDIYRNVWIYHRMSGAIDLVSRAAGVPAPNPQWSGVQTTAQSLSADGRWLVYSSIHAELTTNDLNAKPDVFLYDTWTGERQLISRAMDGSGTAAGASREAIISANGRCVAFTSTATNLTTESGDWAISGTNRFDGLFVWDREQQMCHRVARTLTGRSFGSVISRDGNTVAFHTRTSSKYHQIQVYEWPTDQTRWLDTNAYALSFPIPTRTLSGDGHYMVSAETPSDGFLYLINLTNQTKTLVTTYKKGVPVQPDYPCFSPVTAAEAPIVVFLSSARNLVTNSGASSQTVPGVYACNYETGQITLVSGNSSNAHAAAATEIPAVSANGRWVAFVSPGDLTGIGKTRPWYDVYVRDLDTGTTELISFNAQGQTGGNGHSFAPSISADGRYVVFQSRASNLVPGDDNNLSDVFRRDRWTRTTTLLRLETPSQPAALASQPQISANGQVIAFHQAPVELDTSTPYLLGNLYLYATPDRIMVDQDQDQLDDAWEILRFGNLTQDASGDDDQDGWKNAWEFALGFDPGKAEAALAVTGHSLAETGLWQLTWPAVAAGHYRVQYKNGLNDTAWTDLPATISLIDGYGFCYDTMADPHRFYRLVIEP